MHTEIILPLKTATKTPVDKKFICRDLTEALQNAYPGYICYLESTGKFYRFLNTNKLHEWQVFNIEDYATRDELKNEIAKLVDGSPEVLDTLAEIAAALNNDKDFGQTMVNELVKKVDKIAGMGLSERSFTQVEKTKLSELHNYTHPANHPASIITQDANNRFVTDAEKTAWSAKADKTAATTAVDGLMTASDKTKLNGIATGANNYTHPANHPASIITQDANNRFVTDAEKTAWSAKADKTTATITTDGLMSKSDKVKLDNLSENGGSLPDKLPASIITQDANNRFVTDAEKTAWSAKANKTTATIANDGLMSKTDKAKLDNLSENGGSLPDEIPASMITLSPERQFVTEDERHDISKIFKLHEQLDGIEDNLQLSPFIGILTMNEGANLGNPDTLGGTATIISIPINPSADGDDELGINGALLQIAVNNPFGRIYKRIKFNDAKGTFTKWHELLTSYCVNDEYWHAAEHKHGFMSSADKYKLNRLSNYTHPATHPASMIIEDDEKQFVADWEKMSWHDKASRATATMVSDGLMSRYDKDKLERIDNYANYYTHPANHPASIITQDANNRFVTDTEKASWNDKYTKNEVENKLSALITSLDWKEAVNNFAALATTYPQPDQGWTVNVKDANKTYTYNGTAWIQTGGAIPLVTTAVDGLMTASDKTKLNGIATGANNYTHPANHPASIITQDANNRFVTDAEKTAWNAKAGTAVATTSANGLMSSSDKTKLDRISGGLVTVSNELPSNPQAGDIWIKP